MAEFFTLQESAGKLDVSEQTLLQWIREGRVRASRRGGAYRLRPREVERLLACDFEDGKPKVRPAVKPPRKLSKKSPQEAPETEELRATVESLTAELESAREELKDRQAKLSQREQELAELREDSERLRQDLAESETLRQEAKSFGAVTELEEQVKDLQERLDRERDLRLRAQQELKEQPPEATSSGPDSPDSPALESVQRELEDREKLIRRLKAALNEAEGELRHRAGREDAQEARIEQLQDGLHRSQSRVQLLEREVQNLADQLEQTERDWEAESRRLKEQLVERQERGDREEAAARDEAADTRLEEMRRLMEEKDSLISQEYREKAYLRERYEQMERQLYELQSKYDKEKSEWSELLAREIQNRDRLIQESYNPSPKQSKGWGLFRPRND